MEVIQGDGKDLDISPVYDHVIMDKPLTSKTGKKIIIPKEKKEQEVENSTSYSFIYV